MQYFNANFYFDGFNFYHGICDSGDKTLLWLDIATFCKERLRPKENLNKIHFFTAIPRKIPRDTENSKRIKRHKTFLHVLGALSHPIDIHHGRWSTRSNTCTKCGHKYSSPVEKYSDVAIGCQMVYDAFQGDCHQMYLISADADLIPAIKTVRKIKPNIKIKVLTPPNRLCEDLKSCRDVSMYWRLTSQELDSYKLSKNIFLNGQEFTMPNSWDKYKLLT